MPAPLPESSARAPSSSRPDLRLVVGREPEIAPRKFGRLEGIDEARVLATWGVVWVHVVEMQGHSAGTAALGRFGTSFYVAALTVLAARGALSHPERTPSGEFLRATKRLLRPLLLWSLIYGAYYGYYAYLQRNSFEELVRWWGPFAGTARHLWFLPFAAAMGPTVVGLVQHLRGWSERRLAWATAISGVGGYLLCYGVLFFVIPREFIVDSHLFRLDRWIEEIPLVLLVLGLTLWRAKKPPLRPSIARALALLGAFAVVEFGYLRGARWIVDTFHHVDSRYVSHAAGLALLGAFLVMPRSGLTRLLARLRKETYFVFLSHLLALECLAGWLWNQPGFGTVPFAIATTFGIFAVSAALGSVVRRVPGLRALAG